MQGCTLEKLDPYNSREGEIYSGWDCPRNVLTRRRTRWLSAGRRGGRWRGGESPGSAGEQGSGGAGWGGRQVGQVPAVPGEPGAEQETAGAGRSRRSAAGGWAGGGGTCLGTRATVPSCCSGEGKPGGLIGDACPGASADEESHRARERLSWERPAWVPSCPHPGCYSSPGSQQVSSGKYAIHPGPRETGSHCCLALQNWPPQGSGGLGRAPVAGAWHLHQEVRALDRVSACGNLLFFY
jgi:hypothetical protein